MTKTALIIIDVQRAMFSEEDPVFHAEQFTNRLNQLIKKARSSGAPIFFVQHNGPAGSELEHGTAGWEIYPSISPEPADKVIQKTTPDSFYKTNLDEALKKRAIDHLVLAGIQSEICVDTTCRRASSLDYQIILAADAHTTWDSPEMSAQQIINHHNRILKWFADVQGTNEIIF